MNAIWTEDEKEFIRKNAATMTDSEIASNLTQSIGREVSLQAARKQRQKMKLRKCHGRGICKLADTQSGVSPKPQGVSFHIQGGTPDVNS